MAGTISDYLELKLLDHVLGTATYTVPTNIFIALSTADPTDSGTGLAEPTGNAYTRVSHNAWNAAANRTTSNNGQITFPTATGSWGTISHIAGFDAATGGNMLFHGDLSQTKAIAASDTFFIDDGDIDISFTTGGFSTFLANALLDHVLKTSSYAAPTIFTAFSTAEPTDDGSAMAEPTGNAYARVAHSSWNTASAGSANNNGDIDFIKATGSWGTVSHAALFDAVTGGNFLLRGTLTTSKAITTNDVARISDQSFVINLN